MDAKCLTLIAGGKARGRGRPTFHPMNDCSAAEWESTADYMFERVKAVEEEFWMAMTLRHGCLFLYDCTIDPENVYHGQK